MIRALTTVACAGALLALSSTARAQAAQDCDVAYRQTQAARRDGKLVDARRDAVICAAATCADSVKNDCQQWLVEIDRSLPTVVLGATDPGGGDAIAVRVLVDGVVLSTSMDGKAISLDPGPHKLRFEMAGAEPIEQEFLIKQGEKDRRIVVAFKKADGSPAVAPPPPVAQGAPPPQAQPAQTTSAPVWPWVVGGIGIAALGVAIGFGVDGYMANQTLSSNCGSAPGTCGTGAVNPAGDTLQSLNGRKDRGLGIFVGAGVVGVSGIIAGAVGLARGRSASPNTGSSMVFAPLVGSDLRGFLIGSRF